MAPGIRSNFKMANCHWMPVVSHMNFDQLRKCARVLFVTASKMPARALTTIFSKFVRLDAHLFRNCATEILVAQYKLSSLSDNKMLKTSVIFTI